MDPQIQYCRTSDGTRIAYYEVGSGPPLIAVSAGLMVAMTHEFWGFPQNRRMAEQASQNFTYIRYDPHGCGLSHRDDSDLSLESFVRDLEAVANATAPEPFALFGTGEMTAPALVYAARHPERVTHLVMWGVFAHPGEGVGLVNEQLLALALKDWRMASESFSRAADNWENEELARQMAAMMREAVTPETFVKFEKERLTWDVSEYLPQIKTPTLIIHPRNHPYFGLEPCQRVAAAIPGARLALIDSATVNFTDMRVSLLTAEFLGVIGPRPSAERTLPSGTAIILFADIADSTALTERMGDAAFRERARTLDASLRGIISEAGGTTIDAKTLGDGVLATFPAASQAIAAALRCTGAAEAAPLRLHIGLHAGDVIREEGNVFGGAVNIASRISGLSAPGEVLVSRTVADLARTSAGVTFEDRGEHALKGIEEPQRLYAVRAGKA